MSNTASWASVSYSLNRHWFCPWTSPKVWVTMTGILRRNEAIHIIRSTLFSACLLLQPIEAKGYLIARKRSTLMMVMMKTLLYMQALMMYTMALQGSLSKHPGTGQRIDPQRQSDQHQKICGCQVEDEKHRMWTLFHMLQDGPHHQQVPRCAHQETHPQDHTGPHQALLCLLILLKISRSVHDSLSVHSSLLYI